MSDQTEKIQSVLQRIYGGICAHKNDLKIRPIKTVRSILYEVVPHECDFRKLIGTQGALYKAMLLILKRAGEQVWITENPPTQLQISLEVERTGDGREEVAIPINPKYDKEKMMRLIVDTCEVCLGYSFKSDRQDTSSKSIVQIFVAGPVAPDLAEALNKIFWAYGKATGRLIQLEFSNVNQGDTAQTARAQV